MKHARLDLTVVQSEYNDAQEVIRSNAGGAWSNSARESGERRHPLIVSFAPVLLAMKLTLESN